MSIKQEEIKQIVRERKIKFLLHFTSVSNLASILEYGLLSRTQLDSRNMEYQSNDNNRYDGCRDAVCCSVSFPNSILLRVFKRHFFYRTWVIIALEPSILWEKTCYFCVSNAAKREISQNIRHRTEPSDFRKMFSWMIEGNLRNPFIGSYNPTNPKAEVVVPNGIELKYIKSIFTESEKLAEVCSERFNGVEFQYQPSYFQNRVDYQSWCNRN